MSALTDLFTAMANKIRSKTGTATTYTPSEMVSDGIDDVYDAGVASATTPITPSNSSPASMTANTGYKPTANGYAISSYSSVTPSSTQTSVSSGDIVKIGGSGVIVDAIPTPTSLTPSNSSPATITSGETYTATANGKAVETIEGFAPALTITNLVAGHIYKPTSNGKAVASISSIAPSNSSPVQLSNDATYQMQRGGYAIQSYDSVTPSSTQTAVSSGDIVKIGGNGVIVDAVTSITPSNSSPVSLSSGSFYKPSASGYAISSYSSKTPSDTSPASISSGAIIKASSAGYLHKTAQGFTDYPLKIRNTSSSTSLSLTGLTSSKNYLLLVWNWGGSVSYSDTRFDSTTASGATITKIANLRDTGGSNIRVAGTFFLMKTSSTSVTLSNTNQMLALVFMAE